MHHSRAKQTDIRYLCKIRTRSLLNERNDTVAYTPGKPITDGSKNHLLQLKPARHSAKQRNVLVFPRRSNTSAPNTERSFQTASPTYSSPEKRANNNDSLYALRKFPRNHFHQRNHPFVAIVVPRDDPHHPECIHHRRQRVDDRLERGAVRHVLEMSLEGRQKSNVVLGLDVVFAKVLSQIVQRSVHAAVDVKKTMDGRRLELLIKCAQRRVALAPVVDFGQRAVALHRTK
jgi:hypothetical protein